MEKVEECLEQEDPKSYQKVKLGEESSFLIDWKSKIDLTRDHKQNIVPKMKPFFYKKIKEKITRKQKKGQI